MGPSSTSPAGFLEGIYVNPAWRRHGIPRELVKAVCKWVVTLGCSELASDAKLDNTMSHWMHVALGFTETEKVVFFRKALARIPP